MAIRKTDQPVRKIKDLAEGVAKSETAPPEIRRARAVIVQSSLVVLAIAFGLLVILVKMTESLPIDLQITRFLQASNLPLFRSVMIAVSWGGTFPQVLIPIAIITLALYGAGLHWEALMSVVAAVGVQAVIMMVKVAIHRPRPTTDLVHVFSQLNSYSFPSGHVMFFLGYFGFIWFLAFSLLKNSSKRTVLLVVLGLLLVLVGPSRVYLGAHWPSDILGAYLLGILVLVGIVRVYRWGKTRFFIHQPVAAAPAKA